MQKENSTDEEVARVMENAVQLKKGGGLLMSFSVHQLGDSRDAILMVLESHHGAHISPVRDGSLTPSLLRGDDGPPHVPQEDAVARQHAFPPDHAPGLPGHVESSPSPHEAV